MAYTKVHEAWEDDPSIATPILAAGLDQIEEGIQDAHDAIDAHLVDGTAAHAGAAISFAPTGTVGSSNVQDAIAEVAAEAVAAGGISTGLFDNKGELIAATAADAVGLVTAATADDLVLTSDASQATGMKWAEAAGGANFEYVYGQAVSSANVDIAWAGAEDTQYLTYEVSTGGGSLRNFGAPVAEGDRLRLVNFSGSTVTVKHNTAGTGKKLINAAGADKTLLTGYIAEYQYLGGSWYELVEELLLNFATDAELAAHLTDATDAHDAAAVSVADAGAYFAGDDVEEVLQEIGAGLGSGLGETLTLYLFTR
jgi:hypothetical protein